MKDDKRKHQYYFTIYISRDDGRLYEQNTGIWFTKPRLIGNAFLPKDYSDIFIHLGYFPDIHFELPCIPEPKCYKTYEVRLSSKKPENFYIGPLVFKDNDTVVIFKWNMYCASIYGFPESIRDCFYKNIGTDLWFEFKDEGR